MNSYRGHSLASMACIVLLVCLDLGCKETDNGQTPLEPFPAPANLKAQFEPIHVKLTWIETSLPRYVVVYRLDSLSGRKAAPCYVPAGVATFNDLEIDPGASYRYEIVAQYDRQHSIPSNSVSVTTDKFDLRDLQAEKLSRTWGRTWDMMNVNGYTIKNGATIGHVGDLVIHSTGGKLEYSFKPYCCEPVPPWPANGTLTFLADYSKSLFREDGVTIDYNLYWDNGYGLRMSFNYKNDSWIFVFSGNY